jgi:hypothetical protein
MMPWQGEPLDGRPPKTEDEAVQWLENGAYPDRDEAETLTHLFSKFIMPKEFMWDRDHSVGGPLEQSNYEYWTTKYAATNGETWWDLNHAILVHKTGDFEGWSKAQEKDIERLEFYAALDETRWSNKEWDLVLEAWHDFGRRDFKRELVSQATEEESERDAIEELLDELPDGFFDEWVDRAFWEHERPDTNGWEVHFPSVVHGINHTRLKRYWGNYQRLRTYDKLIEWFEPEKHQEWWRSEVELADTAFTSWKTDASGQKTRSLRIKPGDLPTKIRSLASRGGTLTVEYDEELCENLYVECRWVPHVPPEAAKENPPPSMPSAKPPKSAHWVYNERAQGWEALVK